MKSVTVEPVNFLLEETCLIEEIIFTDFSAVVGMANLIDLA